MNKLTGKKITNINPVKSVSVNDKNFFAAQQSIGDFWSSNDKSNKKELSLSDDIQNQINRIESQTEEYKNILANPFGQNLNVVG